MKRAYILFPLLVASPVLSSHWSPPILQTQLNHGGCASPVHLNASTNVWSEFKLNTNKYYREQVIAAAEVISDTEVRKQALQVADAGAFLWIREEEDVGKIDVSAEDVPCDEILGIVLSGFAARKCHPNGVEFEPGPTPPPDAYKVRFVDAVVEAIRNRPRTAFSVIVEPGFLGELVANADFQLCRTPGSLNRERVSYAIQALGSLPNVVIYIDAGHGGIFGWNDNRQPAAREIQNLYKRAGKPSQLRGFATNVAGYNSWDAAPGEFEAASDSQWNKAQNEQRYVRLFAELLASLSVPNHAIIDTSRNGIIGLRSEWLSWCNINGAGFGIRPTNETGDELADAFVWAKNGGDSDGTSNSTAWEYESPCGSDDSYKPMPEKGEWSQEYFEMLVGNAQPQFDTD